MFIPTGLSCGTIMTDCDEKRTHCEGELLNEVLLIASYLQWLQKSISEVDFPPAATVDRICLSTKLFVIFSKYANSSTKC